MVGIPQMIDAFWRCVDCGKMYWLGPKSKNVMRQMQNILNDDGVHNIDEYQIPGVSSLPDGSFDVPCFRGSPI